MAKKKKAEAGADDDAGGKGGGGKMMPAAMVSIALVAAGYFVGGRGGGSSATTVTSVVAAIEEEPEIEHIIDLDPINVNLADGHYLRIAISIGMAAPEDAEGESGGGGHGGGGETETTEPTAPAADLVLSTFSGKTIEELSSLEGRIHAREALHEGLTEFYGEEVVTVFFTEFVMQ